MSAITNFAITPLAFLSGTFYSIAVQPEPFRSFTQINPFFYLIDGFRYGAIGIADSGPGFGLGLSSGVNAVLGWIDWDWLRRGYRLKA